MWLIKKSTKTKLLRKYIVFIETGTSLTPFSLKFSSWLFRNIYIKTKNNKNLFFFFQNSLLNYSDDTPPVITTKPQRRKRTYKNWILVDDYETFGEALNDIKDEKIWSICSSDDSVTKFRCNKVKKGTEQCKSGIRIILHEKDVGFSVQVSRNPHNCDNLEQSTAKLDSEVRQFIADLYAKGLKRKAIEDEFIAARRPLPARYVLRNEIARLRRNDIGSATINLTELHNILNQHTTIPNDDFTAYVLDHQITDTDEIRFNFVVSCKKLMQLNLESLVCNSDSTYKLIWQGYPVGLQQKVSSDINFGFDKRRRRRFCLLICCYKAMH